METKPQAQSFPIEEEAVARDQRVANAEHCKEMVPEIAVSITEEGGMEACVLRVAIAKQCKEMEPEGAVPEAEEVVACAQGVAITEQCKVLEPNVAVPMEEEAVACDQANAKLCKEMEPKASVCEQGEAKVKQCKEMEPIFAVLKEEEVVACAQSVVVIKPCKEMKPEVAVPMEEEGVASDPANAKLCKEMEPKGAVPMEEEIVACDQQVAPPIVPLLEPRIAKLSKELDPEAVILENEVYLTIEDCSGELPLPLTAANGDGDGNGNGGKNIVNVSDSVNGSKVTEQGLISEPVSEPPEENVVAPEPSWGDVPDEPVTEPVTCEKTPRFPKRQRPAPENVEVDDVVQTMRNILMDLRNVDDARLHPDDDAKVRSLLEYHPQAQEKMGSGIDYIKIKRHSTFKESRCFWVVRTDGTETDFSYHKCLKEKVAKDHPSFVDRYDAIYRAPKRPRQA